MEIAFAHPLGKAPGAATFGRVARSAALVGVIAFLIARAGVGSLAGPGGGDGFATGPVSLTAADEAPMFALPALAPGQTVVRDTTIAVRGPATESRLYADVSGTVLARSLMLTVTLGTGRGGSFVPDEGAGTNGAVVYRGPLASFPSSWADGIRAPSAGARTFRFRVSLPERTATEGAAAGARFIWEAREI